jgi:hypothetical protein
MERSTSDYLSRKSIASGMSEPPSPFTPMALNPERGEMTINTVAYGGLVDANNVPHVDDLESVGEQLYAEAGVFPPPTPPRSPLRQQQQQVADGQRPMSWNGYVVPDGQSAEQRPSSWHEPGPLPVPPVIFYPPPEVPVAPLVPVRPPLAHPLPSPPPPAVPVARASPSPPLPPLPISDGTEPESVSTMLPGAQPTVGGQMGTETERTAFSGLMEEMREQQGRIVSSGSYVEKKIG